MDGELFADDTMRKLYATDASAYRELPLAVALPKNRDDIKKIIDITKSIYFLIIVFICRYLLFFLVICNSHIFIGVCDQF